MESALTLHRLQFAFTVLYHYLFPQVTMGLALLIMILKTRAVRTDDPVIHDAVRFWARIFGIHFALGVVTGIPLEFQFGTNWAPFSSAAGGVIGQVLGMEGVFAFFLESSFLALFLFGERRMSPRQHWFVGFLVFFGAWLSGFFIVATNAWMQHPVGYTLTEDGAIQLTSFRALLTNVWLFWEYLHTMIGSVITACFVMAGVGAFYVLEGRHPAHARLYVRLGVYVGLPACLLAAMPTGDAQAKLLNAHQPVTFAAMEGLFEDERGAPIVLIGQPDMEKQRIDNPIAVPRMLSFLTHQRWDAEIKGLNSFPRDTWPDQVPLLYYAYHIMAGLGTLFIGLMGLAAVLLWRGRLFDTPAVVWGLMLAVPFPFIANTAGWFTAEMGRQPWVIYGLMRTNAGFSANVSSGNVLFTFLGFCGMYALLSMLYLFLIYRELHAGPGAPAGGHAA